MAVKKGAFVDYLLILLGSFIVGFAINNIYDPAGLVTGGVSGIAIILRNQAGVPLWVTNTVMNIPLFIFSVKIKGWKFVKRTVVATAALSVFLGILPDASLFTDDLLLTAVVGGVITGIGTGILLLCHATTGGTDTLAAIIQIKMKHYSIARVLAVLDGAIVLAGASVFGLTYACYAAIAVVCLGKISDGLIEGLHFSKTAYIVSDRSKEIADAIMDRMGRGVTGLQARGMYTGNEREVLFCVVSKKEIVEVKEIVASIDRDAFLIVGDAREVIGEGFLENDI